MRSENIAADVMLLLKQGNLPLAYELILKTPQGIDTKEFDRITEELTLTAGYYKSKQKIRQEKMIRRRIEAIRIFKRYGLDIERLVPAVEAPFPPGGKLMLLRFCGGQLDKRLCIRTGGLWHREILKDAEDEIRNLGFFATTVIPCGGAFLEYLDGGKILISGMSDEFGECDKETAADLIRERLPEARVFIF